MEQNRTLGLPVISALLEQIKAS
jgi:Ubiquitin family